MASAFRSPRTPVPDRRLRAHTRRADVPHERAARQQWAGRLAAFFFASSGALALVTLPLLPQGANVAASALIAVTAVGAGLTAWFVPWGRLPRSASLLLLPPAFALIGAGNAYGGTQYFTYAIFFVVAFVSAPFSRLSLTRPRHSWRSAGCTPRRPPRSKR